MGMQRAMIVVIVVALASATASNAYAGKIVSWVDANGVTQFTDAGLANGQRNVVSVATSNTPSRSVPKEVTPEPEQSTPTIARSGAGETSGKKSGLRGYRSSWARDPDRYKNLD
ncbi:MAG: DUF4124 domain-containing protein [Pseudomonadales bacterium]|nr:DUF4124 domain-containing protein [Pseudomonadales bacterium]NIX08410.1 DUF4124 domain-containing protein [Pseudomonadales bacterium]